LNQKEILASPTAAEPKAAAMKEHATKQPSTKPCNSAKTPKHATVLDYELGVFINQPN